MSNILILEHHELRVLTTRQLADFYGVIPQVITNNFNRNQDRFTSGVHFFRLEGEEKIWFVSNLNQNDLGLKNAQHLYLWTERGALHHAKILNSDKAWEVYEMLVESYFRVKAQQAISTPEAPPIAETPHQTSIEGIIRSIIREEIGNAMQPMFAEILQRYDRNVSPSAPVATTVSAPAPARVVKPVDVLAGYVSLSTYLTKRGIDVKTNRRSQIARHIVGICNRAGIPVYTDSDNGHHLYAESVLEKHLEAVVALVNSKGGSHAA